MLGTVIGCEGQRDLHLRLRLIKVRKTIMGNCTGSIVFPSGSAIKNLPEMQEIQEIWEFNPLEEGMATHSNILAWRIPWADECGGLQSIGLHRVRHN